MIYSYTWYYDTVTLSWRCRFLQGRKKNMMPTELAMQIYCETMGFLEEKGYISHLNKLLTEEYIDA